jgi:predicted NBD/HSP70 family sugar kinase
MGARVDGDVVVPDGGLAAPGAVVGLDIGGSKIHGVLVAGGEVVAERRCAVAHGPEGVVASAAAAVAALLADARDAGASVRLEAVGAGVPGVVAPGRGTVQHAVNLGIVQAAPVGPVLAERLGVPVVVENDLNVAALGAARTLGLGEDLAYLALGTGLAAGLLLDGRLRRGSVGAAGEIGHVPYRPDGRPCPCGQRGCLEQYASGSAVDAHWAADGAPGPARLFAAAAAGEPRAVRVRDELADAVAFAVQVLVLTTDVRHVVLGGGVAQVGAPLLEAVGAATSRRAAGSPFLATLRIADRLRLGGPGLPVAPVGAALAAQELLGAAWRS